MKPINFLLGFLAVILATFISVAYIFTAITIWTIVGATTVLVACVGVVVYKIKKI